ncbi:hypothetical protein BSKO_11999 [Bryopsis sp. KO-2023]|nr:hypothetical protein BSKO_11999 [Bryopsis sp. KO-2023]
MGFPCENKLPASMRAAFFLSCVVPTLAGTIPLLFPSPLDTSGNIYNNVTGNLLPVEASFVDSVCVINDEEIRFGESQNLLKKCGTFVLYTESSVASFTVMDLSDDGEVVRKIREPEFNVTVVGSDSDGGVVVTPRFLVIQKESGETMEFSDGTNYQLTNLPPNKIVRFEVSEFDQATRHIYISRSTRQSAKPPTAKITRITKDPEEDLNGFEEYRVTFSDWVVLNQLPTEKYSCTHELEHRFVQGVSDGAIAINQTLLSIECPQANLADFSEPKLKQMVEVQGASNVSMTYIAPPFDLLSRGKPTIVIRAMKQSNNGLPQANSTLPLSIAVPKGRVVTFGGVPSKKRFVFSDSLYSAKDIQKASDYATSMSVMAGAGVTTAVTTSVGVAVASASTGTVAGSTAAGSMSGASNLLNEAQRIFLIGQLALAGLPETCQELSDGLEWTMLNIKLPWEDESAEEEDRRIAVKRTLFWSAVVLSSLFITHCIMLVFLLRLRIGIPSMLRLPRLELYFGYWAIPALATASAGLFKDDGSKSDNEQRDDVILGVALLLIFPGLFIALHIYTLWSFFYRRSPQTYKAIAVFENEGSDFEMEALRSRCNSERMGKEGEKSTGYRDDCGETGIVSPISDIETNLIENHVSTLAVKNPNIQDRFDVVEPQQQAKRMEASPPEEPKEEAESGCCGCWGNFWEKYFWTPVLGPPYSGEWMAPSGPRNLFYARFGAMFEEFRGKPMGIRGNTYGVDAQTHSVVRGTPTPIIVKRSFYSSPWEGSSIGHHLQVSGKIFDMFKLVFIASLISGEDDPQTVAQVIVILTLSVIFFISLRIFRTPISRWDLGMAMFGELTDIITFTIALIIFVADLGEKQERTIGWIMMVTKTLSFLSTFLDQGLLVIELVQGVVAAIKQKLGINPKLLEVFTSLQKHNPQYLERKFFNRWVRNTIGKGIQAAPLKHGVAPFEEVVYFRIFGGRPTEEWKRGEAGRPETKEAKVRRERILSHAKEESRFIIRNATERARRRAPPSPLSNPSSPLREIDEHHPIPSSTEIAPEPVVAAPSSTEPGDDPQSRTKQEENPENLSPFFYPADETLPAVAPEPSAPTFEGVGDGADWEVMPDERAVRGTPAERPDERPARETPTFEGVGDGADWEVMPDERPARETQTGSTISRFFRRVVSYTSR